VSAVAVALMLAASATFSGSAAAQVYSIESNGNGGAKGNGPSANSTLSADEHVIAFVSAATNLVPSDTNGSLDVFVRGGSSFDLTRVSVSSDGLDHPGDSGDVQARNSNGYAARARVSLSADGSQVAFASRARLAPNDTNSAADIYVHDRTTGQTTLVSLTTFGGISSNDSYDPQLSADGRLVVFTGLGYNQTPQGQMPAFGTYLHDRVTHTTTQISPSATVQSTWAPSISADGQIVLFLSWADAALTTEPDPWVCPPRARCGRVYMVNRATGRLTRIPLPTPDPAFSGDVVSFEITPDARYVAMGVQTVPAADPDGDPLLSWLALYDRNTGRVEWHHTGGDPANVSISADGRFIGQAGGIELPWTGPGGPVEQGVGTKTQAYDRKTGLQLRLPPTLLDAWRAPQFADRGLGLLFETWDANVPSDTNVFPDVYWYQRDANHDDVADDWSQEFNAYGFAGTDNDQDGVDNATEYLNGTDPNGSFKRYFAEGAANSFFTTRFSLFNPNDQPETVVLEFLGANGESRSAVTHLAAHGIGTVTLDALFGVQPDADFSTIVESDHPVIVDRTMTWDAQGYGSHAESAIEAPGQVWYLAEGATHGAFDLFYLLENPGDIAATATVTYLRPAPLAPLVKQYAVAAKSRRTIWVDQEDPELAATDVSAKITADQPILVERSMYYSTPDQPFAGGTDGAALPAPALRWFLAEGATGSFFDLFVLIANAESTDAQVTVRYLLPDGTTIDKAHVIPAQSRVTIAVEGEDPRLADTPVSTIVSSTNGVPVLVERSMWWPKGHWYEGHLAAGSTTTGSTWALAGGLASTGANATETYILIANTSPVAGAATVTLYFDDATTASATIPLPANSRANVPVSVIFPQAIKPFGSIIKSADGLDLIVERAMYSNAAGVTWAAGTSVLATRLP
jgi:hypothetical protein